MVTKHKGASYNSLMKHMRASGFEICGAAHKRQLMLTGYFHGYKGYRYNKNPECPIPFANYEQMLAVIDFDERIKAELYRPVMQLESALKSVVTDVVVNKAKSDSLSEIMDQLMHPGDHKKKQDYLYRKYCMRDMIHSELTRAYNKRSNNIVAHYYNNDSYVPIWAVFEVITLGQFGIFVDLLDPDVKKSISGAIGLPTNCNTNGALLSELIFFIQDFRNAIAHNNVVFDSRYHGARKATDALKMCITQETRIRDVQFDCVIDDIILIVYLQKIMKFKKLPLYATVRNSISAVEDVFERIGPSLYMKIFSSNSSRKLGDTEKYLHKPIKILAKC